MDEFNYLDEQKQVYASIIAEGDEAVGRIMKLLKELGIDDNTLVIFSTDNGPEWEGSEKEKIHKKKGMGKYYSVGETGGLKGQKRSLFAGGIRVPFIVRWPAIVPQGVEDKNSVITAVDLLPTFLEAAGIEMLQGYQPDGESVLSAFMGNGFERSKPIFWEWRGGVNRPYTWPSLGVRNGDWKLVVDVSGDKYELFNIKNDWKEEDNLADSNPEKTKELLSLIKEWKQTLPKEPKKSCLSPARKQVTKTKKNKKNNK
jgi:N-acetylgalactosamine-6-sulfatase